MSKQLRYLLHGNKEKYEDITTPLYITSQESTVWQKVGQQVLQIRGEDWRLIDPLIVEYIPSAKRQILGIKLLQTEEVVDLIRELGADCVDGNLLEPSERYELLRYIRQRPSNQELWKSLQLHETVNGELVCIESGKMYLENPDFTLDERLKKYIVLIRQNKQEIDQEWIPFWTPDEAIATIVTFANPEKYCDLILNALQQLSTLEKDKWESELKNFQWLVDVDSKPIQPRDVIKLPINLVRHQQMICTLDNTKYSEISLNARIKNHPAYSYVKKLFTFWKTETILEKFFARPKKTLDYWRDFSPVILDALQDIDISKIPALERLLTTERWLVSTDKLIAPQQVIEIVSKEISKHLFTLVEISEGEYAELSLLSPDVQNHDSLKIVKKLFSRWNENHVIEFILSQSQPYLYFDIILDALSSLFSNANQRLFKENNEQLKIAPWLVDIDGNAVYPENILHYPDIQIEIEELLLKISSSYIASSQLNQQIRSHENCWQWLSKELFLNQEQVLSEIGTLLRQADEYQLGQFEIDEFPLDEVVQIFNTVDVSFLPAWNLVQRISLEKFKKYLLPNLLGKIDEEKLIKILQNLADLNNEPEAITIKVFNCYLKLAVKYNSFSQIIGQIRLLNHHNQWQTPDSLTWGNRENIDGAYLLNKEQTAILHPYLKDMQKNNSSNALQTSVTAADETNSDVLQNYFRAWELYCPTEPIGAFLTLLYGSEGIDIISNMLAGDRAMGYLITRCQSLPSGLYGRYRQLVSLDNVNYKLTGKISEKNTFLQVANWPCFQKQYQNNLIARDKWQEVKKLLGEDLVQTRYVVNDLRLVDILKNEIGNSQPRVGVSQAIYLGSLISKDFLNNFSAAYELNELQNFLETVYFMSKAGSYLPCQQLLIINSNAIEEKLLVDFAPDSRILHTEYKDTALNFFYTCRSRRDSISKDEIIKWALQATTEEQRKAVYIYLLQGEQREEIASSLYANRQLYWFANDKQIIDILELMVLIVIERGDTLPAITINKIQEDEPEIDDYNPLFEIHTNCTRDDFSLERSAEELEEFALKLQAGFNSQNSYWKGYIYHFTHVENAVSILTGEKLLARNLCGNFSNSAGANLIDRTRSDVKDFARFYCRPQTPTQWHNEGLGKRRGNIYALCPVPIFFRFDLKRVLETHGTKCGVSSGNLAASGSHYGNSTTFLEQCFDFDHVYSTLAVGKETFLRASQQEFIVHNYLDFTEFNLEDISIICRTTQDKDTLLKLIGTKSKYANRVFEELEIVREGSLFYHNNPYITINDRGNFIDIQIDNYDKYGNINGELILSFTEQLPFNREIISPFKDISKINFGQSINVSSSRSIQLQYKPNTPRAISF